MTAPTSRRTTHTGPVFSVEVLEQHLANGGVIRKDVVRHPGAVTIVPVVDGGAFVMIRNDRISVGARLLEFPAGKIDAGESPDVSAARELQEETGYEAEVWERVGCFHTSPGMTDETMHVFEARRLTTGAPALQPGEDIEVELVPVDAFAAAVRDSKIVDGKTIAAWTLWRIMREGAGVNSR